MGHSGIYLKQDTFPQSLRARKHFLILNHRAQGLRAALQTGA
jgi:hypothetical protein